MERFQELRDISNKKLWLADHILTQTYPFVKDPKLLLSSLETVFLAYSNSIASLIHYEKLKTDIPDFEDRFDSKFKVFLDFCAKKYSVSQEDISVIKSIKELLVEHKKSPIEFSREDRFIICSDEYQMKSVSVEYLKKIMANAKVFIEKINNITSDNNKP